MPINTKYVKEFDLTYISKDGLVLRFPTIYNSDTIKEYQDHPGMFKAFKDCSDWAKTMRVTDASLLNDIVSTGKIDEFIRINEAKQNNELLELAKSIKNNGELKAVLLAGPSSSGKTTTSKKLCMYLK